MTLSLSYARSITAQRAFELVKNLQGKFVADLSSISSSPSESPYRFTAVEWARAGGRWGGGVRYVAQGSNTFNRASVNISQVQYEDDPSKRLASATALSTIIHPESPRSPSMHMHISWTEMKKGQDIEGYWRIMADLNPSHPDPYETELFVSAFAKSVLDTSLLQLGQEQGDRYFYIPALGRARGVAHFYLEEFKSEDPEQDIHLAEGFGRSIIDAYVQILTRSLAHSAIHVDARDKETQLAYHTLYFLQVLTLDRGTTSGLLVHNENDVGILGSLPSHVNREQLKRWLPQLPEIQRQLLSALISELPDPITEVTDIIKQRIAELTRLFYTKNPGALELLARGHRVPPTQDNHR
jgi:coproporphyrinogen III oxidase